MEAWLCSIFKMKKIIFIVILALPVTAIAQCFTLAELQKAIAMDSVMRNEYITAKDGYQLTEFDTVEYHLFGTQWRNQLEGIYLYTKQTNDTFNLLGYLLTNNAQCFAHIKNELAAFGYKVEDERLDKYQCLNQYYTNDNYGILMQSWPKEGAHNTMYYAVKVLSLNEYRKVLAE